ncbi:MAG TPA: alpha/beta fold hydrolase [Isosphaeraceae bacterium]|nr:alpha/beta fold hydrolase [Isosphaeraceae bacterium]
MIRLGRWLAPAILVTLPVGYTGISLFSADLLTRTNNRPPRVNPLAVGRDARGWSVRTEDGLTLRGWYYPTPSHRRLVVLVHGMGESWDVMAGLGRDLHARGYDLLLFDLRGHGRSDPARLTMGRRERADVRAVLAWARAQGFDPGRVGWIGQSMGASTVLMEGVDNPDVRLAVLDSPYGDLPELLDSQLTRHSHLPGFFNPGILLAAHQAYGVRTDDLVPIRLASHWGDRPVLLIHGEADTTVPIQQAYALRRSLGPSCRLVPIPGVEHVEAYRSNPRKYVALVHNFLQNHMH